MDLEWADGLGTGERTCSGGTVLDWGNGSRLGAWSGMEATALDLGWGLGRGTWPWKVGRGPGTWSHDGRLNKKQCKVKRLVQESRARREVETPIQQARGRERHEGDLTDGTEGSWLRQEHREVHKSDRNWESRGPRRQAVSVHR